MLVIALAILFLLVAARELGPVRGASRFLLEGLIWLVGLIAAVLGFLVFTA